MTTETYERIKSGKYQIGDYIKSTGLTLCQGEIISEGKLGTRGLDCWVVRRPDNQQFLVPKAEAVALGIA